MLHSLLELGQFIGFPFGGSLEPFSMKMHIIFLFNILKHKNSTVLH